MINQAQIEIRSRDVKVAGPLFGSQHLFIIHTDSNGQETIIRGGHETDTPFAMFTDDLKIVTSKYKEELQKNFPNDWVKNNPSITIATGNDAEMQLLFDKMWKRAEDINAGNFDYKLPTPWCSHKLCHVQNSNTIVAELVKAAELELKLPIVNGKPVSAPGIDGDIKDSIIDKTNKLLDKTFPHLADNLNKYHSWPHKFSSKHDKIQSEGDSSNQKGSNLHSAHKFNDDHHFAYAFLHPQNDINFKSDYGRSRFTDENHFKRGSYWQAWQHNQERPKEWSPHLLKNKKDGGDNSAPPTAAADGPKAPSSGGGGGWFSAFTENLSNKFTNLFSPPKQEIVELRVSKSSIFEQYKPNFNSLYDFTLTKKSGFINDPSWLYIAPIQQKQSLGDDFSKFLDAKQKLIHKVSSCAQSGFCFDSYESMVRDVAASFLGNYESFSNLALLLQTNKYRVIERASSELSFARKTISFGNWLTTIRQGWCLGSSATR